MFLCFMVFYEKELPVLTSVQIHSDMQDLHMQVFKRTGLLQLHWIMAPEKNCHLYLLHKLS